MRRLWGSLLVAILLFVGVGATACQASPSPGFIHTQGNQLLDGAGNPIQLDGVGAGTWLLQEPWLWGGPETANGMTNVLTKLSGLVGQNATDQFEASFESQFITQSDIQQIAADGFNVVRVAFNARYQQTTYLDNVISWAKQSGIYVVLDMHAAPCSQNPYFTADSTDGTAGLWYGPGAVGCRQQTVSAWQALAARYAGNTTVAAYDLLNEPDGLAMTNAALTGLYRQTITAIRSFDPNHVVMVEGRNYTRDNSPFTAPLDSNLVLSIHQYSSTSNPAQQISQAVTAAGKLGGVPIWVGEYGLDTATNVASQVGRFASQSQIVGWSYWTWKSAIRSDNQNGLNEYVSPASWTTLLNWLDGKSGATQPTVAQATSAMAAELAAINTTTPNAAVIHTLQASQG